MLAPNKQNLLYLRNQKKVIQNGLKLLKEKRTGLVTMLMEYASKGKALEGEVQQQWKAFLPTYQLNTGLVSTYTLMSYLTPLPAQKLSSSIRRVSGVYLNSLDLVLKNPQRVGLKHTLSTVFMMFTYFFPKLLKVIELKINCSKIAIEIEKTNRQINNLENLSEQTQAGIKFISSALSERANQEKATLIQLFS